MRRSAKRLQHDSRQYVKGSKVPNSVVASKNRKLKKIKKNRKLVKEVFLTCNCQVLATDCETQDRGKKGL